MKVAIHVLDQPPTIALRVQPPATLFSPFQGEVSPADGVSRDADPRVTSTKIYAKVSRAYQQYDHVIGPAWATVLFV